MLNEDMKYWWNDSDTRNIKYPGGGGKSVLVQPCPPKRSTGKSFNSSICDRKKKYQTCIQDKMYEILNQRILKSQTLHGTYC